MCRAAWEPGGPRRCDGQTRWCVNREGHARFVPDENEERHWFKPVALLSMTPGAIRVRRHRAAAYAREVDAIRTVNGVKRGAAIGPVLREELWGHRHRGACLSLIALASRFQAIAAAEGVPVEQVAARHQSQTVRPHRQTAGQRLHDLVVTDGRPDWVDEDRLVQMVEPVDNGTPNPAYLRVVSDAAGREWVLVSSYDGSEPMCWPNDPAGLKAGAWEALERVRAVKENPDAYDTWLDAHDAHDAGDTNTNPFTQTMTDSDFLANSAGMHLT